MKVFSHSRLSCFEQCPFKFKIKYLDKVKPDYTDGIEAFLGKRVHETLEQLYKDLKFKKESSLQDLLLYYHQEWDRHWHDSVNIVREQYTPDHYRKMGETFIAQFFEAYHPFTEDVLSVEEHVKIDLGDGYILQGYIDRLDQTPAGYEVHDYKTGSSVPSQQSLDSDRQLALYALAIKEKFKDTKKVELVWHYLAHNKEMRSQRTDEELAVLKAATIALIKRVKATTEFPTKKSRLCDWCEYRSKCPEFKHLYELEQKELTDFSEDDGSRLVDDYTEAYEEKKDAERRMEEIREQLIAYADQFEVNAVFGTSMKASVKTSKALKFPSKGKAEREEIIKLLKAWERFEDLADLDTVKLAKSLEDLPEAMKEAVMKYVDEVHTSRVTLSEK